MDGLKARLSFDAVAYDYDDEYLTIDTDTHTININNVSRLFGVQYDGNSKLIKFRIRNKLSDIQKMQDSIVYINWIDQKGVKGQSIAINKTINNDTCEFAWKVPFDALKNSGVLHFAMSAVITENGSSVINQKWSTQIASVITPDGIYIKSYTPNSEEEDRIAQIYNELSKMINKQNDNLQSLVNDVNLINADIARIGIIYKNIIDTVTLEKGFMGYDGGGSTNDTWRRFTIPVKVGEKYSFSGGRHITCYYQTSATKENVINGGIDTSVNGVITIPPLVTLMTVSFKYENINDFVLTKADKIVTKSDLSIVNPAPDFNVYSKDEINNICLFNKVYLNANPTNYRQILESIQDSSFNKQYVILLSSGEYDLWNMFTTSEKNNTTFKGLYTPKFTSLIGIEKNVIFKLNAPEMRSKLAPINLDVTACIKNCTVIANNCRYAIHDDWQERKWFNDSSINDYWSEAYNKGYERVCENVETQVTNSAVGASWGGGVVNSTNWKYKNCKIGSGGTYSYICHNDNSIVNPANITLDNCRLGSSIRLSSLNKGAKTNCYAHFIGTKSNGVALTEEDVSLYNSGIRWFVDGYANTFNNDNVTISNTDGLDYSSNVDLIK